MYKLKPLVVAVRKAIFDQTKAVIKKSKAKSDEKKTDT